jgi:FkbM family methyltransferase
MSIRCSWSLPHVVRDWRYRTFYRLLSGRQVPLMTLGETVNECHWTFCPNGLGKDSIIYSGGVGNDITFEHALVKRFGCNIVMLDPSPTGIETMSKAENKLPQFRFCAVALAGHRGALAFAPPINPEEGSWYTPTGTAGALEVPCTDLTSLLRENGHDRIDLLKIDIEGSEYEVIDDILDHRIPVRQICVEFHHSNLPGIRRGQTIRAMLKLRMHGYKLINQYGTNHTFLRAE